MESIRPLTVCNDGVVEKSESVFDDVSVPTLGETVVLRRMGRGHLVFNTKRGEAIRKGEKLATVIGEESGETVAKIVFY